MCIDSDVLRRQSQKPKTGYRCFELVRGGKLRSLYWHEDRNWEQVNVTTDDPAADSDLGFHALNTLEDARSWRGREVYGQVVGSGKIVRHRSGFRSTRMRIKKLYLVQWALAERYGYPSDARLSKIVKRVVGQLRAQFKVPVEIIR